MRKGLHELLEWGTSHSGEATAILVAVLAVLLALVLFLPQALLVLLGVTVLAWASYTPTAKPMVDHGNEQFYIMLFQIFMRDHTAFGVILPGNPEVLAVCWPGLIQKGGVEVIRAEVEKRAGASLAPEQFKQRLQKVITAELRSGRVLGVPAVAIDQRSPVFLILDVEESDTAYIIDGVYLNNKVQLDATAAILRERQRLHHERLNPATPDVSDDEF